MSSLEPPTGLGSRLDLGIAAGSEISGDFDSPMAKLIVTCADRQQAIRRARRALKSFTNPRLAHTLAFPPQYWTLRTSPTPSPFTPHGSRRSSTTASRRIRSLTRTTPELTGR
ncbi:MULTISPECIES: hypothetical protein [Paenarthrobacter]|uniref:hypothetical protein n=1 Tax=Paenarthrobacter TaxID=1742992 RepID=UPI001A9A1F61